jgi:hypothetical protein
MTHARWIIVVLAAVGCGCGTNGGNTTGCTTDQNGVQGGHDVVFLTVTDTGFSVGGPDSGSTQPNITVENAATVTLTLSNVGSKPHDLAVQCMATPNSRGCPEQSCFPPGANIPALGPGQNATTTFVVPTVEGAYPFVSDLPGDMATSPDGGETGLVGEFLLM